MKVVRRNVEKMFVTFALAGATITSASAVASTANDNGDWANASTWDTNQAPGAGDILVIAPGVTVSVTGNIIYSGNPMHVQIYGTLDFVGSGSKLSFPCGSIVEIMTSSAFVTGNANGSGQTIRICNNTYWSVGQGPRSGYLAWPEGSTLPVELLSFTATAVPQGVAVRWSTATETNSAYFQVQCSVDGAGFFSVAQLEAGGNSQHQIDYAYMDEVTDEGDRYYRLLQIDNDGATHDLGMASVHLVPSGVLRCFPVPARDLLHVVGATGPLELLDANGLPVRRLILGPDGALVDLEGLAPGRYWVRVDPGQRPRTVPVVVLR